MNRPLDKCECPSRICDFVYEPRAITYYASGRQAVDHSIARRPFFLKERLVRAEVCIAVFVVALTAGLASAEPRKQTETDQHQMLSPAQRQAAVVPASEVYENAAKADWLRAMGRSADGVYDLSDTFSNPRGFPLGGWTQIKLPAAE
jgi:hypothetical protein